METIPWNKLETLRKLTELRMKYPSMEEISNNDKLDYIKELEFFATGINQKIYDIKIVTKMSGSRLISQYDIALEEIVKQRRKGKEDSTSYIEYEKIEEEIKNTYMGILICKQHYVCRILRIHEYVGTYTGIHADFRRWI